MLLFESTLLAIELRDLREELLAAVRCKGVPTRHFIEVLAFGFACGGVLLVVIGVLSVLLAIAIGYIFCIKRKATSATGAATVTALGTPVSIGNVVVPAVGTAVRESVTSTARATNAQQAPAACSRCTPPATPPALPSPTGLHRL